MRSVSVRLCDLENIRLNMGYVGENEHVHVLFDCKKAFDQYPNAVPSLVVVPPKGDSYPAVVTREGDIVEWVITDSDLIYAGNGKIQLQFQQGDIVMKSAEMRTIITPSAIATGTIPTPIQNWIAQANAILAAIPDDINAALAEAQASGVFDGVGIASIEKTGTSGNVDTYTITLTDENSYEFTVTNGTPGQNGVGIQSIAKTSTSGLIDTYTITLTNNQTYTFTVTNGENGVQIDDVTPANNKVFSSAKVDEELNLLKSGIQGKIDKPETAGTAGQVLGLDNSLETIWITPQGGSVDPQDIEDAVDEWLTQNISNPDSPPLDRSLSSDVSAAPADIVGDIEAFKGHTMLAGTYSGTRYLQVEKTIPAGKYHVHVGNISSTDVDKTTCRFTFSNSGGEILIEQFNRGTVIDVDVVLESEATKVVMYASSIYAYTSEDTFTFTDLVITKRYELLDKINDITGDVIDLNARLPVFNDYEIKTVNVLDSFSPNHKAYLFSTGANISNYATYGETNDVYSNTPPVKIRNKNGELIYNGIHLTQKTADTPALWTFDINGDYLRSVTFTGMGSRATTFLSDEYYAIFNEFPTVTGYTDIHWIVSNIDIEWLNGKNEYTVGTGGDFATFTSMLIALANDKREKTVYIKGGTYDIFEEMGGAEYIASIAPDVADLNWKDVCHVVPPNTKIIGLGNVILSWLPTAQQMISESVAFLFSPLNIMGNCHIENISVVAQNCRYTVHDESNGIPENDGAKHYYKNCRFTLLPGSYGFILYGAGHNRLMDVRFDDCVFDSQNSSMIWSTHDWTTDADDNSVFIFNNCVFTSTKANPHVRFSSGDTVGRLDKVMFNNCYLQKVKFVSKINGNVKQGYDVQLIGCTPVEVEYDERVTDRVAVRQYNPIPQST